MIMDNRTIEQKVASAILEKPIGKIEIDGRVYNIAPPSTATLILISEIISTLPIVEKVPKDQILYSVLHNAKYFKALGEMAAILILGANHLVEEREIPQPRILGIIPRKPKKVLVDAKAELAEKLMYIRPSILNDCILNRLQDMEVVDFFVITTSLSEANILKPTKEVER
jgi:hypothetical protein